MKLPLELRELIYTYGFGGRQLYLEITNEKVNFQAPFRLQCLEAQQLMAFVKSCKLA